jgi:shikimate dehydrogenase
MTITGGVCCEPTGVEMATFLFIGVTTAQSSSMRTFPRWMEILGHPQVEIEGVDLALGAPPEAYRQVVRRMKEDVEVVGALVTSHKIDLLEAAGDLFDELSPHAALCGEVSAISRRDERLLGHAVDPEAGWRTLHEMLGSGYFGRTGGHLLCLGAGGAGTALALAFSDRPEAADRPDRFTAVDNNPARLERLKRVLAQQESSIDFRFVHSESSQHNNVLVEDLPQRSLVINATGMGKDRPGSPLTDGVIFPEQAIAWELNYRGDLDFWRQARQQAGQRHLRVEDGWRYFLHGWLGVIAYVLDITIDDEAFERCAAIAAEVR